MREIKITAYDEEGRIFEKKVTISQGEQGNILDFGGPCRYYIKELIEDNYPLGHDMCIDAGGMNHNGSPVYVRKDDVNHIMKKYLDHEFH